MEIWNVLNKNDDIYLYILKLGTSIQPTEIFKPLITNVEKRISEKQIILCNVLILTLKQFSFISLQNSIY